MGKLVFYCPPSRNFVTRVLRLFENEPFEFSFRYGSILENLYTAAFFAPVFPLGLLVTFVSCYLDMIADRVITTFKFTHKLIFLEKYVLIKRSAKAKAIGSALAFEMMDQMEFLILIFGVINFCLKSSYIISYLI